MVAVPTDDSGQRSAILICGPAPNAVGGGPTHIRNLWASPLSDWFQLELFRTGSTGTESPASDERMIEKSVRLLTGPFRLATRILAVRPAIVHINSAPDLRAFWRDATLLPVAKLLGRKVVFQLHGGTIKPLVTSKIMRLLTRVVFAVPDVMVVLATCTAGELRGLGRARRIALVPNGVNVFELSSPGQPPMDRQWRLKRLGFLGRLVEAKGLRTAIDALALLRTDPSFPDLELRLAGSGDARERLEEYARLREVDNAVHFVGTFSGRSRVTFLRETDVLILVGGHNEGMPYALLEAMAVGTPVIASAVGGNVDVVRDGIDGRIVPPEDARALASALRELAADPDSLRNMSIAAASRARSVFSLERLAMNLRELYSTLGAQASGQIPAVTPAVDP